MLCLLCKKLSPSVTIYQLSRKTDKHLRSLCEKKNNNAHYFNGQTYFRNMNWLQGWDGSVCRNSRNVSKPTMKCCQQLQPFANVGPTISCYLVVSQSKGDITYLFCYSLLFQGISFIKSIIRNTRDNKCYCRALGEGT